MATMGNVVVSLNKVEVIIALHTHVDPPADEWEAYLDVHINLKRKHAGDLSRIRNFVVTDGGAPNAAQRAQLNSAAFSSANKVVVITNALDNPIKRGVATAISWANPSFKALPPERWREALQHVNLENQIEQLLLELSRLQIKLPPVSSLSQLIALQM